MSLTTENPADLTIKDDLRFSEEKNISSTSTADPELEAKYITGPRLYLIVLGLSLAALLTGLVYISIQLVEKRY
jgi:hypothetical protein